jgi:hypothetical protein
MGRRRCFCDHISKGLSVLRTRSAAAQSLLEGWYPLTAVLVVGPTCTGRATCSSVCIAANSSLLLLLLTV